MTTATPTRSSAADFRAAKADHDETLQHFDERAISHAVMDAARSQLDQTASSASETMGDQVTAIRQSVADFEAILERMGGVQQNVQDVTSNVGTVVVEAQASSDELGRVAERMHVLEEHFAAINGLIKTVNDIADKTNLLSLNATIEAARAGEAGRGFAVVAAEVKELSHTTKNANQQIRSTLDSIAESVSTLSTSIETASEKMSNSVSAVEVANESAALIGEQTSMFSEQLATSLERFADVSERYELVENEVAEIDTIGNTFASLLEMMRERGVTDYAINPLDRLGPLVEQSSFNAPDRFTSHEDEYVLHEKDVLISATDEKGRIVFANNTFYRVAQYEQGELTGKPHNVIRHPDMPRMAFADLWSVIQDGQVWQGFVLNRGQHGRRYWVKASVFPCYDNGTIVGYLSVRSKPDAADIKRAMAAYRLVP